MNIKHPPNFKNLKGKTFGRLKVLEFDKYTDVGTYWIVKCDCGNKLSVLSSNLQKGNTQSCGCLRKEVTKLRSETHGLRKTRFYYIWNNMKARCLNPNNSNYSSYGGQNISLYEPWYKFINFMTDMYGSYLKHVEEFGEKDTTIERIDVYGNYEPGNVRWATWEEQAHNTRKSSKTQKYEEHKYWRNKLCTNLSTLLHSNCKTSPTLEFYLGCMLQELRTHLEMQFLPGMTWDNYGQGAGTWQLDHIIGCNNFDLSKEEDRKKCFNYTNLRPMWYVDHRKKSVVRL